MHKSSWMRRSTLGLLVSIVALFLSATPAAAAEAPAPVFQDRCGTSQDLIILPAFYDASYFINGVQYEQGRSWPPPTSSVTVTATGSYTGSWSFNFTNTACPLQATDKLIFAGAQCDTFEDAYRIHLQYLNSADASGLDRGGAVVKVVRSDKQTAQAALSPVPDGQSVEAFPRATDLFLPGHYTGTAFVDGVAVATVKFFLDRCGFEYPPYGDTEYYGPSGGYPQGKLKQLAGRQVRVKLINKHNPATNEYRLTRKFPNGSVKMTEYIVDTFRKKSLKVQGVRGMVLTIGALNPARSGPKRLMLDRLKVE